jgi:hypothetical protein
MNKIKQIFILTITIWLILQTSLISAQDVSISIYTGNAIDILTTSGTESNSILNSERTGNLYRGTAIECMVITALLSPLLLDINDYLYKRNMITIDQYKMNTKCIYFNNGQWILPDNEYKYYYRWINSEYNKVINVWLSDDNNYENGKLKLLDFSYKINNNLINSWKKN